MSAFVPPGTPLTTVPAPGVETLYDVFQYVVPPGVALARVRVISCARHTHPTLSRGPCRHGLTRARHLPCMVSPGYVRTATRACPAGIVNVRLRAVGVWPQPEGWRVVSATTPPVAGDFVWKTYAECQACHCVQCCCHNGCSSCYWRHCV